MTNLRNIIMLSLLAIFFAWYGLTWAYKSLYKAPRAELSGKLAQYRQVIDNGRNGITTMQQFIGSHQLLYYRSLPRLQNDARANYSFWFLELLKFCELSDSDVNSDQPTRTRYGMNYRFHVRGRCSLEQLSRLLFEFYSAPFLHRITAMSITPLDGMEDRVAITMTVDAAAVRPAFQQNPYPTMNRLPEGHFRRLQATQLDAYKKIAERNLLQAAKGGVDKADYAKLTAVINSTGGTPEVWIFLQTDNNTIKATIGDFVRIGSFRAKIVDISDQDVVFQRDDQRWLLSLGDTLNQAFALPPEAFLM